MMKINLISICFILLASIGVQAQDSSKVTNEFKFKSGIYYSLEAFQRDQPDLEWENVRYDAFASKEKRTIQFKYFYEVDTATQKQTPIPTERLWGICVNGVPYIRVFIESRGVSEFVVLRTRGRICYFNYEGFEKKIVPMTIYDPNTGEPIMRQNIENKISVNYEKMFRFEDGVIEKFSLTNFKQWIGSIDNRLLETLVDLEETAANERLYKSMKIFNDRNPVYIKQ